MESIYSNFSERFARKLLEIGLLSEESLFFAKIMIFLLFLTIFLICLFSIYKFLRFIVPAILKFISVKTHSRFDDKLLETAFPKRFPHLIISILFLNFHPSIVDPALGIDKIFGISANIYFIISLTSVFFAVIDSFQNAEVFSKKDSPVKGFFQALKLLSVLFVGIWILSILCSKSPMYFISGLGALMAILLIVFKDTLLGFTAGIIISSNDTVHVGDWIEIDEKTDGAVEDISLTTVKIRNWDNTISAIPAYSLVSAPFKNWSGMTEKGGRRIKRAINIDLETIHFATGTELEHWNKMKILQPYLAEKIREIRGEDVPVGALAKNDLDETMANSRHLTNIGTFRAYCLAYLKQNSEIHKDMTLLVRQLNPGPTGIPIEIYAFSKDTRWENYEKIQSDIFDHLFAILSEFNLRSFQNPTGKNFEIFNQRISKNYSGTTENPPAGTFPQK